uniref:HTH_48 domain-containing protein n=1 Tax=Heterorhabditis bacteriophora TaxID=37862 RepID=A0A1I7XBE7_HETBA
MRKKQIRAILLYEFKMGGKVVETAHNISRAFGVGTDNERTAQFRNGDESLEDEERRGRPLAIDDDQLKTIVEADSHKTTRVAAEEVDVDDSTVGRHLHQMRKSNKFANV